METKSKPAHIGRNISRLRELRGMKQEALANALGVSQQTVSALENSEVIDDVKLKEVAVALGVTVDAVKNFNEESIFNFFNSFNDADFSNSNGAFGSIACTFNPLDKLIEAYEENKRLYERLIEELRNKRS